MQKYIYLISLFLIILAAAITGLYYVVYAPPNTSPSAVILTLTNPSDVTSGDEVNFLVKYKNGTGASLSNANLFFHFPEGSVPAEKPDQLVSAMEIGAMKPGEEGSREFKAQVIGAKNSVLRAEAELTYNSAGVAEFRKDASSTLRIADISFLLNFIVPQKAVSGESITYFLQYNNLAAKAFGATRITAHYPDGFAFSSAEPAPLEGNNIWDIGEVPAGGTGQITIKGALSGNEGDTKKVDAEIGFMREGKFYTYTENSFDTVLLPAPLAVAISLDDHPDFVAKRGDTLTIRIRYKNNTEVPIREAVLRAELGGGMFDEKKIDGERGFYDSVRKTVIWTPANVKDLLFLNPGEEHEVVLRAALKNAFPFTETSYSNFMARVTASIESVNVPSYLALNKIMSSAVLEVKLVTQAELSVAAFYRDDSSGIVNTGPMPLKVDKETRFTVHWRIIVPANDLENVEVRTTLPTGITPTGEVISRYTDAKPSFDATTGEVSWFIPKVPANVGVFAPAYETIFQIAVTPSITQSGDTIELVRQAMLTATDSFTGTQLSVQIPSIRTEQLAESMQYNGGRVVP